MAARLLLAVLVLAAPVFGGGDYRNFNRVGASDYQPIGLPHLIFNPMVFNPTPVRADPTATPVATDVAAEPRGQTVTVYASFYSCIGDSSGAYCPDDYTAAGTHPNPGTAACGSAFALGTRLSVPGWGEVVCLDRGNGPALWVDVWTYDAATGWAWQGEYGQWLMVLILEE